MGSFSCVESFMVCIRFLIAGNCCFIVVIGIPGIGDLCLCSASVRVGL